MDRNIAKSSTPIAPSTWLIALCPRSHASPQTCHHSASSVLAVRISCRVMAMFLFIKPLFTVIMAPKRKSNDTGSASKRKRSRDVLPISEKVTILDIKEIGKKKTYAETARLYGKNECSIREVMKNKEKISLLYRLLRIRLKHQNQLLSYVRERETVHCKCTMQCTAHFIITLLNPLTPNGH